MTKARYIMVGGFLGAGKTTAILKLAEKLAADGQRVGLITNDQSVGLVDTAMLQAHGFAVEEITGGCFCCRFNSLVDAADRLTAASRPDVFIAEPVGSCTDLRATVSYPLRRLYGDAYSIAPLTVLVDPVRALRALEMEPGRSFSQKVLYVYRKQLEEAELILINKCDAVEPARVARLNDALRERYPRGSVLKISARTGVGLDAWIDRLAVQEADEAGNLPIDYIEYGEGEALLGWLNATVRVSGPAFDGNAFLPDLARHIHRRLEADDIEIAHLKMTLAPKDEGGDLAVFNQVRNDHQGELSHMLMDALDEGELILNLRAEGDPEVLRAAALAALAETSERAGLAHELGHVEHFRPGQPTPTYRLEPLTSR